MTLNLNNKHLPFGLTHTHTHTHTLSPEAVISPQLSWEEDNVLSVFAPNPTAMEEARENLQELLSDKEPNLEFGGVYSASVVELRPQGVMLTLYSNMNPVLLHNSQLDTRKVRLSWWVSDHVDNLFHCNTTKLMYNFQSQGLFYSLYLNDENISRASYSIWKFKWNKIFKCYRR